jgi:hypothetical protein
MSKWEDSQFRQSHKAFNWSTLLLVVYIVENYAFTPRERYMESALILIRYYFFHVFFFMYFSQLYYFVFLDVHTMEKTLFLPQFNKPKHPTIDFFSNAKLENFNEP